MIYFPIIKASITLAFLAQCFIPKTCYICIMRNIRYWKQLHDISLDVKASFLTICRQEVKKIWTSKEAWMNSPQASNNMVEVKCQKYYSSAEAYTWLLVVNYFPQKSTILYNSRSSHQRYSVKKAVFKNFAIFTGKRLC